MIAKSPEYSAGASLIITLGNVVHYIESHTAFFGIICTLSMGIAGIIYNKKRISESQLSREQAERANDLAEARLNFEIEQAEKSRMTNQSKNEKQQENQEQSAATDRVKVPPTDPKKVN